MTNLEIKDAQTLATELAQYWTQASDAKRAGFEKLAPGRQQVLMQITKPDRFTEQLQRFFLMPAWGVRRGRQAHIAVYAEADIAPYRETFFKTLWQTYYGQVTQ